ncbi:MAG: hypothetical protein IKN26_01055 [Eubacterium sp.]|nr:hypothetical protein [Eubacterium sp.]
MADKKEKKIKTKQQKAALISGIILAVLFVLTLGTKLATNPNSPLYRDYAIMIMPKSISTTFEDKELVLYIEKNKKYDKEKSQPLEAFQVYYYENNDTSKEKVYLKNGTVLKGKKEQSNMMVLQFLGNATITDSIIRNILNKTLVVLCILLVCWLIYIWYLDWCRRKDKKAHSA